MWRSLSTSCFGAWFHQSFIGVFDESDDWLGAELSLTVQFPACLCLWHAGYMYQACFLCGTGSQA